MSVPFARIIIKKVNETAYRFEPDSGYTLVIITQSLNNDQSLSNSEEDYKCDKINVMTNNGNKNNTDTSNQPQLYDHADATVKDKHRRFLVLLIETTTFYDLCPDQARQGTAVTCNNNTGTYDKLHEFAQWTYTETLRDISLYCKEKDITKNQGKYGYMKNAAGEKVEVQLEVQVFGDASGYEFLKNNIWSNDDDDQNKGLTKRQDRGARRNRGKQKNLQRKNHDFELTYFSDPRVCPVCQKMIWGIARQQGYQCRKCQRCLHLKCINKVLAACQAVPGLEYESLNSTGNNIKIDQEHILEKHRNFFSLLSCSHSGKLILPFTTYHSCKYCTDIFKTTNKLEKKCGAREFEIYQRLKEIDQTKDVTTLAGSVDAIYGKIGEIKVDRKVQADAMMERLAETKDGQLDRIGVTPSDKDVFKKIRQKSKRANKQSKYNDFDILLTLGQGSFGKVLLAKYKSCKSSGKYLAIKAIRKDVTVENYDVEAAHLEKDCLVLNHQYLAKAICTFQDAKYLYYCMEFLAGGDLMHYVLQRHRLKEPQAKVIGLEVLLGLRFLHEKKILYRDLKLDNIMIGCDGHIRIADFGMVKTGVSLANPATTFCGTPDYMAPEILQNIPYTTTVDIWAWAVVLWEMIEGFSPFQGSTEEQLYHAIKWQEPRFKFVKHMSKDMINLMQLCLIKNPSKRANSDTIINHKFFTSTFKTVQEMEHHKPPVEIPPTDFKDFKKCFDSDFTNITKSLEEPGIRSLGQAEDQIFSQFSWSNPERVTAYKY